MTFIRPLIIGIVLAVSAAAAPLPQPSYIDVLILPVGVEPLAEFEQIKSAGTEGSAGGIQVKEVPMDEIPPRAVYIRKNDKAYYSIPSNLNAFGMPIRIPVADTEIPLFIKSVSPGGGMEPLATVTLPATRQCVLVILSKPITSKKWTKPLVTTLFIPPSEAPSIVLANSSSAHSCGVILNKKTGMIASAGHQILHPQTPSEGPPVASLSLAIAAPDGRFRPPFIQEFMPLRKNFSEIIVAYDTTEVESFRFAAYARGKIETGKFLPPSVHLEK
ncbi:MAG: hypothetical protein V4733_09220 [Verrucomicrobiota bacterium]